MEPNLPPNHLDLRGRGRGLVAGRHRFGKPVEPSLVQRGAGRAGEGGRTPDPRSASAHQLRRRYPGPDTRRGGCKAHHAGPPGSAPDRAASPDGQRGAGRRNLLSAPPLGARGAEGRESGRGETVVCSFVGGFVR
jgi:hypothetical protein